MNMDNSASTAKKKQRLGDKCSRNRQRSKTGKAHNRAISQRAGVRRWSSATATCRMLARNTTTAMGLPGRVWGGSAAGRVGTERDNKRSHWVLGAQSAKKRQGDR